ncbi:undecaprenyl diphosphate synthase [Pseudoclavibacter sp. JAI123]|uniref:isoprenyl transferase n=1 Tax=Pseudoclavibacter sp. JAI123 TaxID=2723065 RepID=UPI0015CE6A56|nr:isoprenyl transferase [Pseudoclavibacter sp. JAI123]NYF13444.1 undecaprenyl diphosphate synthase [Pseudoclavibacter sp. JAI123]
MSRSKQPREFKPVDWTGVYPPQFDASEVPSHVAVVMDGNGRWANQRGLPRIEGHRAGEAALLDVVAGALQVGVKHLSAYAFSTENWKRSPEEVRFLMGFNRDVLHRQRDQLNEWGVRIRWAGREPRLWKSVIKDLQLAERLTKDNTRMTLTMCVNYGGRLEIADAVRSIAEEVRVGRLRPERVTEQTIAKHLYDPEMPDVDLFVRSSGEQRTSNFLLWQAAYAEMCFLDTLWPDFSRTDLWEAIERYAGRDRRFGGAVDAPTAPTGSPPSALS